MSTAFLLGIPGKLKILLDRLTQEKIDKLTNLDAAISSRASGAIWDQTKANLLNVSVSSRADGAFWTTNLASKVDTSIDTIIASLGTINTNVSTRASGATWTQAKADFLNASITSRLATDDSRLAKLDANITTRLASDDSRLAKLDANISTRSTLTADQVWSYSGGDRTLTTMPSVIKSYQTGVIDTGVVEATMTGTFTLTTSVNRYKSVLIVSQSPRVVTNSDETNNMHVYVELSDVTGSNYSKIKWTYNYMPGNVILGAGKIAWQVIEFV